MYNAVHSSRRCRDCFAVISLIWVELAIAPGWRERHIVPVNRAHVFYSCVTGFFASASYHGKMKKSKKKRPHNAAQKKT